MFLYKKTKKQCFWPNDKVKKGYLQMRNIIEPVQANRERAEASAVLEGHFFLDLPTSESSALFAQVLYSGAEDNWRLPATRV